MDYTTSEPHLVQLSDLNNITFDGRYQVTPCGHKFRSLRQARVWIKDSVGFVFMDVWHTIPLSIEYVKVNIIVNEEGDITYATE